MRSALPQIWIRRLHTALVQNSQAVVHGHRAIDVHAHVVGVDRRRISKEGSRTEAVDVVMGSLISKIA